MGDKKNYESRSSVNNTSSLASSLMTRIVSNAKFAVETFDGSGHFGMWKGEVLDVLFQQSLAIAIEEKKLDSHNDDHITSFNKLATDLRNMDMNFTDGDMSLMLLSSLPNEFEHLETTLLHRNDEVNLKEVWSTLYSYEQRKREKQKGEEAEASIARDPSTSSDLWLMDIACSYHMCPNRDWFVDLQERECGFIHTANDNPLTVYGVGSIRLRNHDGLSRTLIDVRYVPYLKKNLISVGGLESKGFKVIEDNGMMRICSDALVVMKAFEEIITCTTIKVVQLLGQRQQHPMMRRGQK
ncbi:uncharacterized protein LOC107013393 [Solanum pennellii]|uniref:Uncharacterized protein LOC107013393 n=1 Tax=Solanum pennellii TaxID=28526 RepID=A0ABM1GBR2_SOLPN|nr:uncharacterized protein LOC107013393 [Solanum pennellii]